MRSFTRLGNEGKPNQSSEKKSRYLCPQSSFPDTYLARTKPGLPLAYQLVRIKSNSKTNYAIPFIPGAKRKGALISLQSFH